MSTGSSVQMPDNVELRIAGTRALPPRDIDLSLDRARQRLTLMVMIGEFFPAHMSAPLDRCYLKMHTADPNMPPTLWFDICGETYSSVNLLAHEAEAIAAQFEPHGLKVKR